MVTQHEIPSLVGYRPEEAESIATQSGMTIRWMTTEAPRWLSAHHEARVGRQRLGDDGVLELLQVLIPVLRTASEDDVTPEA